MAHNAKLMATLSKGGGSMGDSGGGGGGGSNNGGHHRTPWKEKKLCPNCNKMVVHKPANASLSRRTQKNARLDGVSSAANDRDRGPTMMIFYNNG